jgi:hypothetical protein
MNEKIKPERQYQDTSLDFYSPEKYVLSIQFSLNGLSFSLLDSDRKKFTGLADYNFPGVDTPIKYCHKLDEFFGQNDWLKGNFKETYLLLETPKATLIPDPLYEESEKDLFLRFNHPVSSYEQTAADYLSNVEAYQIYTLPDCLKYRLDNNFKRKKIFHFSTPLIESLLINNKNSFIDNKLFVHVRATYMDIILFKGPGLRFFNSFYYTTPEDFIYYIMFVVEQLGLNPEDLQLQFLGHMDEFSDAFSVAGKYIRNIGFEPRTSMFGYSYLFDKLPAHQYYNLFNVNICGL